MSRTLISILIIFLVTSISTTVQGQEEPARIPLSEFIKQQEEKFSISFSYSSDQISPITIVPSDMDELAGLESYIEKNTPFFVQILEEQYYLLKNKYENGKITLCGTVLSAFTKLPIAFYEIKNMDSQIEGRLQENGSFNLYLAERTDQIKISADGYKTKVVSAELFAQEPCKTIQLEEVADQNLEEVLITQFINDNQYIKGKKNEFGFNPEKIGILPNLAEPDILESLKVLPGVQSISESATQLLVRGGSVDENAIYWNNIRMYDDGHLFGTLSAYNPFIVKQVSFIRAGTAPRFGNFTSGVVAIETREALSDKITGEVGTSLNIFDINLNIPFSKKLGFWIAGRRSYVDVLDTGILRSYQERVFQNNTVLEESQLGLSEIRSEKTDFNFSDYNIKSIYQINADNQIAINGIYSNNTATYRNTIFNRSDNNMSAEILTDIDATIDKTSYGLGITWKNSISDFFSYKLNSYYSQFEETSLEEDLNEQVVNNVVFGFINSRTDIIKDWTVHSQLDWKIHSNFKLSAGYQFTNLQLDNTLSISSLQILDDNPEFTTQSGSRFSDVHSPFYNIDFTLFSKLSGSFGARHSLYTNDGNQNWIWEPRALVHYKIVKGLKLRMSYEEKSQNLNQKASFYDQIALSRSIWSLTAQTGNNPLAFRQSTQYSAGTVFQNKNLALDIDFYHREVINLPSSVDGLFSIITADQKGKSDAYGIDVLLKKQFKGYTILASYSYLDQLFDFTNNSSPNEFRGSYDATHSFAFTHSFKFKNLAFAIGWRFRTGIPFSDDIRYIDETDPSEGVIVSTPNNNSLKEFHKLDANLSYTFRLSKTSSTRLKVVASALNMYDRKNEIGVIYRPLLVKENLDTGERTFTPENSTITSLGFTPNISLRFSF